MAPIELPDGPLLSSDVNVPSFERMTSFILLQPARTTRDAKKGAFPLGLDP